MAKQEFTAVHTAASKLNILIGQRKWTAAYFAADHLDTMINIEHWKEPAVVHPQSTITDLAEERFKRAQFQ
jgi:hypothetical protein